MTEIEKKALTDFKISFCSTCEDKEDCDISAIDCTFFDKIYFQAYKDGYEQGQKDFDTDVTKLLNSYGVTFIDTNSIGGLIALHQFMLDLEKENEELKAQIEKMKCCGNCANYNNKIANNCVTGVDFCFTCTRFVTRENNKDKWELAE